MPRTRLGKLGSPWSQYYNMLDPSLGGVVHIGTKTRATHLFPVFGQVAQVFFFLKFGAWNADGQLMEPWNPLDWFGCGYGSGVSWFYMGSCPENIGCPVGFPLKPQNGATFKRRDTQEKICYPEHPRAPPGSTGLTTNSEAG